MLSTATTTTITQNNKINNMEVYNVTF